MAWKDPLEKKFKNKPKKHKYNAQKSVSFDGYCFASRLEKRTYEHLKLLEKAGEIKVIKTQDKIYLTKAKIIYMPDFLIQDVQTEELIWVEAKGIETPTWRIKKRLWKYYGPGKLQIYKAHRTQGCILTEEIVPESGS